MEGSRRAQIAREVTEAIRDAQYDTVPEAVAVNGADVDEVGLRLHILSLMLDPKVGTVDRAIRGFERSEPFPTVERERIADYVTSSLERRMLGENPIPLDDLARAPLAWADSFTRACVPSGITEVRRSRARTSPTTPEYAETVLPGSTTTHAADEDGHSVAEEALDYIAEHPHLTPWARTRLAASSLLQDLGLPPLNVGSVAARRHLLQSLATGQGSPVAAVRTSLRAAADLASGADRWRHHGADDALMDLWADYTSTDCETLLEATDPKLMVIVHGHIDLSPRPQESIRLQLRRAAKVASDRRGWASTVMRLERAFIAEHFAARTARDTTDQRTDEQAEADRLAAAADWVGAAQAAIDFPGCPVPTPDGRTPTVEDVSLWLTGIYRQLSAALRAEREAA